MEFTCPKALFYKGGILGFRISWTAVKGYGKWTLSTVGVRHLFYYEVPEILIAKSNPLSMFKLDINKDIEHFRSILIQKTIRKYHGKDIQNNPDILKDEAMNFFKNNPFWFFITHIIGQIRTLTPFYPYLNNIIGVELKILKVITFLIDFLIMCFFILGLYLVFIRKLLKGKFIKNIVLLFFIIIFYFTFLTGLSGYSRFRVPIIPYITFFASFGLMMLPEKFKFKESTP